MTSPLLSAIERFLTPALLGRIATALGIDPRLAQAAAAAGVPAILAGLAKVAGTPGGADRIGGAAARSAGLLDGLPGRLSNPGELIEQGQALMTSLLGSGATNALMSGISGFVGGGESSSRSILGTLTPLVLGVLGREQRSAGGDGSGLAQQLRAQAGEFTAAMPPGLSGLLESSGFLNLAGSAGAPSDIARGVEAGRAARAGDYAASGRSGDFASRAGDRDHDAPAPAARQSAMAAGRRTEATRASNGWSYWAVPLAAIVGGVIGYLLPGERPSGESPPSTTAGSADLASAIPASSLMRSTIAGPSGETLGTVQDVLVTGDGRSVGVVLGTERTLGLGEKRVALPMSAFEARARDGGTQLVLKGGSKDMLANAPAYEKAK